MESNEKQAPAKDETDDNAEASVEQGEMDKTAVDKTLVKDISDSQPKNLVKQDSFKSFAVNENEQCEMSTDLDFCSISRSSDLSNNPTSAISPSEDDDHKTSARSSPTASTSNPEKKEASLPKNGDEKPKWYRDPSDKDTSDDDEFSEAEFANFDFNEGDIMEDEEEGEIPKRKLSQGPIEVVDLSSDSEGFKEREENEEYIISKVQDSESDDVPVEEIPVDLSLDSRVSAAQRISSLSAQLPAVHVQHIIPVIELSDDENDQNDDAQKESGEQAAAPVDDTAEAPVDDTAEAPVDDTAEAPADNIAEAPAGDPADNIAEAPADNIAEAPAGDPADNIAEDPADNTAAGPEEQVRESSEKVRASDEKVVVSEEMNTEQELHRKRKIESEGEGESDQKLCKYDEV